MEDILKRIPYSERGIPAVVAEPYLKVSDEFLQLEGLCFDREDNLVFCDVFQGGIYRVKKGTKDVERILSLPGKNPSAVKLGPDGRLYIACLGDFKSTGSLLAYDPDTQKLDQIIGPEEGFVIDDLCFRSDGSFYFSNFIGGGTNRVGGIYHAGPRGKIIRPVCRNLAVPNGLVLTPDERGLWITEMGASQLHFLELLDDGVSIADYGDLIPYRFSGLNGPDSCSVDSEGNLYVAMYQQGRVLIFSPQGVPVEQVLLPGSWNGEFLRSTHPKIVPGTDQLLICSNDYTNGKGAAIFSAKALARG